MGTLAASFRYVRGAQQGDALLGPVLPLTAEHFLYRSLVTSAFADITVLGWDGMDGWMDGWKDGQTDRQADRY
jgi:hypothetical protein